MTLNFSEVLAALAGNNTTKPTNNYNPSRIMRRDKSPSRKDIICFKCGEKGHISPKCTSEKVKPINNISTEDLDEDYYDLYPAERRKMRSESRRERSILNKERPIETYTNPPLTEEPKKKRKPPKPREPSMIDQATSYDVMGDLMTTPAHITFGQLMKFSDVRRCIVKSYQRLEACKSPYFRTRTRPVLETLVLCRPGPARS